MLNTLLLTAVGVWLGAMVFFASVVAPTVFGTLEPQLAGHMIRRVFPRYYLFGLICLSVRDPDQRKAAPCRSLAALRLRTNRRRSA